MADRDTLSDLEAYAKECIAAQRYPNDYHFFTPVECPACGVVPLVLTIKHHTGSRTGNFKGVILARCSVCGGQRRILSFTGKHRKPTREESPVCKCGNASFIVAECERMEGDEGVLGFFDEGVVVGRCAQCGQNRVFVYTD